MAGTRNIAAGIDIFFQGAINGRDSHFRVDLVFCAPNKTAFEPPPPDTALGMDLDRGKQH